MSPEDRAYADRLETELARAVRRGDGVSETDARQRLDRLRARARKAASLLSQPPPC